MTLEHSPHSQTAQSQTSAAHPEQAPTAQTRQHEYRKLPAVDSLLNEPAVALLTAQYGTAFVIDAARKLLANARAQIADGDSAPQLESWPARLDDYLAQLETPLLRPVINATGVIIHTNLGRAPLSDQARKAVQAITEPYSNLEYDLATGQRGSRYDHARDLLCELTGAEDAIVANNCASALYLVLTVFCRDLEVIISRSQLVEIGGGFRIPDVLRQSGARLVEVGTTNRTHARDYAEAIGAQTAALLRVHPSNFRQIGFVTTPALRELTTIAQGVRQAAMQGDAAQNHAAQNHAAHNQADFPQSMQKASPLVIDDLGSGALLNTAQFGLMAEPTAQESIADGADIVTFSGDKLLGGPQAGIIIGRAELIGQVRRHPMMRALRVDKMTLAALEATLRSYQRGQAEQEVPIWQMISASTDEMQRRAQAWQSALALRSIQTTIRHAESAVGGGSLPGETLPTHALALSAAENQLPSGHMIKWAEQLRQQPTPVICRIQDNRLLFDPRTVLPSQEETLLQSIHAVMRSA